MMTFPNFNATTAHAIHFFFEWLAIFVGVQVYRVIKRRKGIAQITDGSAFYVIGNKLLYIIECPQFWATQGWLMLVQGQSIVGGLLGGLLGVELAKKITHQTQSTGDDFILPLIVGTIVGRIGCFLAGLHDGTFGNVTTLPWGIDFGDGVYRHPTQIYDMLAVSVIGLLLWLNRAKLAPSSGLSFKIYLTSYLFWRFVVDGFKPVPYAYAYAFGWSGIQWVCLLALCIYLPFLIKQSFQMKRVASQPLF
jgi:phosphatidylglycerol:prolipoprotein diacylglycerol transferase